MSDEETKDKLSDFISIAIVVVSLITAGVGFLSGSYAGQVGDAQDNAVTAAVNRQQTSIIAHTWLYQDLRAYAEYQRLTALTSTTETEAESAQTLGDEVRANTLREQSQEYQTAAAAKSTFFSSQYVLDDDSFDQERFLADQLRFESRNLDTTDPELGFQAAEKASVRLGALNAATYGFALVAAFLVIASLNEKRLRLLWLGGAVLILVFDLGFILAKLILGF
jgi:hypothetical protein